VTRAATGASPRSRSFIELHVRNNRATSGLWDLYAEHRQRLGALVADSGAPPGGRLCVLGAGNANDLDLELLTARFAEVHLVDLDGAALGRALARASSTAAARLHAHAPLDVGGALAELAGWERRGAEPARLRQLCAEASAAACRALPGPFDLVLSDCLLTQIYWSCFEALGNGAALNIAAAVCLETHLQTMATLAAPGAPCLLATDVISSDTFALDEIFPTRDPAELLAELARSAALFTGTSPATLLAMLRQGAWLREAVERPRVLAPWLWRVNADRTVLVYGLAFRRRANQR
jgi:hypothetical protein